MLQDLRFNPEQILSLVLLYSRDKSPIHRDAYQDNAVTEKIKLSFPVMSGRGVSHIRHVLVLLLLLHTRSNRRIAGSWENLNEEIRKFLDTSETWKLNTPVNTNGKQLGEKECLGRANWKNKEGNVLH